MKASVFPLALAALLFAAAGHAKELYVDADSGSDNVTYAENSATNPWQSLGRALWGSTRRSNQNGAEAARAGDTVNVAAGTYVTDQTTGERYIPIYNPANSGESGNPIRIVAEGTVRLEAPNAGTGQPIIGTYSRQHIVWDGFLIDERNVVTTRDTGPVVVWSSNNITLQNLDVRGYNRGWVDNHNGIRLENVDGVVIRTSRISGYNESQHGMNASAITMYRAANVLVENNEIHTVNTGVYVKGANPGPVTIRRNRIYQIDGEGIIFGEIGTPSASNGARAYQNVISGAWAGISFIGYNSSSPAHVYAVNNTIANVPSNGDGGAILFRDSPAGYRDLNVYNNLVLSSGVGVKVWHSELQEMTLDYNAYYDVGTVADINWNRYSLSSLRSSFGEGMNSVQTNPRVVDLSGGNFRLQSDSPIRQRGRDVLDLDGDGSTSDSIAIGAYITGNETIGAATGDSAPPSAPSNVSVQAAQ